MNILEQTHYPNKVCYDFDDEPFKIGRMSEYLKFKENGHLSYYSYYEFRFLDFGTYDDTKFHDERLSWDGWYPFQHDDTDKAYINYYNIK